MRTGRAYAMDGNAYVNRPGPRLLESAELFAAALDGAPALPPGIERCGEQECAATGDDEGA